MLSFAGSAGLEHGRQLVRRAERRQVPAVDHVDLHAEALAR